MNYYKCEICSKNHDLITLFGSPEPDVFKKIANGELDQSLDVISKGLYLVNREYALLKCELSIEIIDFDDNLDLSVWVKIDSKLMYNIFEASKLSGRVILQGILTGQVPFYNNEVGGIIEIEIDLDKNEAAKIVKIQQEGTLGTDFISGINLAKMKSMLTDVIHVE